jgi:hypothetical protein
MTNTQRPEDDLDPFDKLGAAASRVLRAAMVGSAAIREHGDDVEAALRELEFSIARILREAELAASDLRGTESHRGEDRSEPGEGAHRIETLRPRAAPPLGDDPLDETRVVIRRRRARPIDDGR